ncbi:MAG TPA: HNH endonuclease signature motif containing protein [Gaiellaceae bacterium]|nr:HNH endonuclease signature motif containing protein [Gaiellaceae bacterium]
MTLRSDNRIEFVRMPWSLSGMINGRYALRSGKRILNLRWKEQPFRQMKATQQEKPVALLRDKRRTLWTMHDCFYWEDEGLGADDIRALIHQRERRSQHKLETARSLMRADEAGTPTRTPIPTELRRAVFERDGGRCVECESSFDLQYDHILPVSRGGATTPENLQILCADCNRRKSDSL